MESDVAGIAVRLRQLDQLTQLKANPGHDHRPGLHAAHTVDALFQREAFDQVIDVQRDRFGDLAVDTHFPAFGFQAAGIRGRIGFIQTEFVEVVVTGDFVFRRHGQLRLPGRRLAE
ncbi:hypothetical protein D3C76_1556780 [compost metagenome]